MLAPQGTAHHQGCLDNQGWSTVSWSRFCSRCMWPLDVDSVYSQVSCWHCCAILEPVLSFGTFCSTSAYLPTVSEHRESLPMWRLTCHQEHCQRLCSPPPLPLCHLCCLSKSAHFLSVLTGLRDPLTSIYSNPQDIHKVSINVEHVDHLVNGDWGRNIPKAETASHLTCGHMATTVHAFSVMLFTY